MGAVGGTLSRVVLALVLLVSVVVLFAPASDVPSAPAGVDKVVHLLLFAGLAISARWAGGRGTPVAAGLVLYAVASELVQGLTPLARSASPADLIADVVGVLVGSLAWAWATRRKR
ncbi:VanZ family protein [Blastococcus montanus]|uniref:VanZ family protein n=1 Tax=Blastococcus montanus TaxID=3144973 RepID=UPI00320B84B8